jgi:hypothetical protein
MFSQIGKADIMKQDGRLTHEDSHGLFKDLLERLASYRGHLWHNALKRFLVAASTDFYMLEIGQLGKAQLLLEQFHQAGFSISPEGGRAQEAMRSSAPKPIFGKRECFCMVPVRAMDLKTPPTFDSVSLFGHCNGCVATSWEAACRLLMEVEERDSQGKSLRRHLLDLAPTPIVWTFVGGDHENRTSFAYNSFLERPMLVALISSGSDLGFKGIAEAEYVYERMGRDPAVILPSDVFAFSIRTVN